MGRGCVLADHFLNAVGLGRRERFVWTLDQGHQPIGQPGLTPLIDLGTEGVEPSRHAGLHTREAATVCPDSHLHALAIVEDEDTRPDAAR